MKVNEWRKMDTAELRGKRASLGEELFKLKFRNSYRRLDNTARLREIRHDIARIETILSEKKGESVSLSR